MSVYDLHRNFDDNFFRNAIIGFLNVLHENVRWNMQLSTDFGNVQVVEVPFYFSTTGDERFLQDNFLNDIVSDPEKLKAEGPYNKIPRGIVELNGLSIDNSRISNKYIRVIRNYQETENQLKAYSVEAFYVPMELQFSCTVHVSSMIDQLKCTSAAIEAFYKNKAFVVDLALYPIHMTVSFPESYDNERTVEFGFDDEKTYTVRFDCEVRTEMPVFNESTKIFKGDRIETFGHQVKIFKTGDIPSSTAYINNRGNTGPTATYSEHIGVTGGQGDSWPINPSTDLPPMGGTGY